MIIKLTRQMDEKVISKKLLYYLLFHSAAYLWTCGMEKKRPFGQMNGLQEINM